MVLGNADLIVSQEKEQQHMAAMTDRLKAPDDDKIWEMQVMMHTSQ